MNGHRGDPMTTTTTTTTTDVDGKGGRPNSTPVPAAATLTGDDGRNFGKVAAAAASSLRSGDRHRLAGETTPPPPPPVLSVISSDSMSKWRRANMKYRKQTIARFEPKSENEPNGAGKTSGTRKRRGDRPTTDGEKNAPKVTIKFARTAQEETDEQLKRAAAVEPQLQQHQRVAALKLKYLGVETKSKMPKYCVE